MARCGECGFDWETSAEALIAPLARLGRSYRAGLTRFLEGEDGDALVRIRPSPEVWSALEYTAHVRDVVRFYVDRIERVLAEDRPTMHAADFASMAERERYREEDVASVLETLDASAIDASHRLRSLTPVEWARVGIGSEGGERTVLDLARRLAHDGHHHLLDLGRVLRTVRANQ